MAVVKFSLGGFSCLLFVSVFLLLAFQAKPSSGQGLCHLCKNDTFPFCCNGYRTCCPTYRYFSSYYYFTRLNSMYICPGGFHCTNALRPYCAGSVCGSYTQYTRYTRYSSKYCSYSYNNVYTRNTCSYTSSYCCYGKCCNKYGWSSYLRTIYPTRACGYTSTYSPSYYRYPRYCPRSSTYCCSGGQSCCSPCGRIDNFCTFSTYTKCCGHSTCCNNYQWSNTMIPKCLDGPVTKYCTNAPSTRCCGGACCGRSEWSSKYICGGRYCTQTPSTRCCYSRCCNNYEFAAFRFKTCRLSNMKGQRCTDSRSTYCCKSGSDRCGSPTCCAYSKFVYSKFAPSEQCTTCNSNGYTYTCSGYRNHCCPDCRGESTCCASDHYTAKVLQRQTGCSNVGGIVGGTVGGMLVVLVVVVVFVVIYGGSKTAAAQARRTVYHPTPVNPVAMGAAPATAATPVPTQPMGTGQTVPTSQSSQQASATQAQPATEMQTPPAYDSLQNVPSGDRESHTYEQFVNLPDTGESANTNM